ncbi:MAG: 23S rRNA (pseudouridine(1915)-N(3))-methyltransferase RlmH [Bacteroidales bacterium]|nr:23S rRNA (pseudouridine(1915)-N(3))-methyltransferase RlmH [Bacteroidales bacterium]
MPWEEYQQMHGHGLRRVYCPVKKYGVKFAVRYIADVPLSTKLSPVECKEIETEAIKKKLPRQANLFLLDETGKAFSSEAFAAFLEKLMLYHSKDLCFVIGGAYGFSNKFKADAAQLISLSSMTFTHQMARCFCRTALPGLYDNKR